MNSLKLTLGVFLALALSGCEQASDFFRSVSPAGQAAVADARPISAPHTTIRTGNSVITSVDEALKDVTLTADAAYIKIKDGVVEISAPGNLRIDSKMTCGDAVPPEEVVVPVVQEQLAAPDTPPVPVVEPVAEEVATTEVAEEPVATQEPESVRADLMDGGFQLKSSSTNEPKANVAYRIEVADGRVIRGMTDENGMTQQVYSPEPQQIQLFLE